jgi:wyosine [tRNA(Phe)-imidazoG37] synthetase (radical SAM superfamily)
VADRATSIVFGPVPSRRLGRSLGIDNIPPKVCSYSCAYCQVGPTADRDIRPRAFYPPGEIVAAVAERVALSASRGERIDHLTVVPDGEPTLDAHLGEVLQGLRPLGIPTAVISNGSLWWQPGVRDALREADWVSAKVDAVTEGTWRRINRPDPRLRLETVLEGVATFAGE